MTELSVEKQILINSVPAQVFDALTASEQIVEYFPFESVQSSWSVGSELRMQGTVNGQAFTDYGLIQVFDRPRAFAYSYWSDNHGTENLPQNHASINYRLQSVAEGTWLQLLHSNLPSKEYCSMMNQAWEGLLTSLKAHVESQET